MSESFTESLPVAETAMVGVASSERSSWGAEPLSELGIGDMPSATRTSFTA